MLVLLSALASPAAALLASGAADVIGFFNAEFTGPPISPSPPNLEFSHGGEPRCLADVSGFSGAGTCIDGKRGGDGADRSCLTGLMPANLSPLFGEEDCNAGKVTPATPEPICAFVFKTWSLAIGSGGGEACLVGDIAASAG